MVDIQVNQTKTKTKFYQSKNEKNKKKTKQNYICDHIFDLKKCHANKWINK